MSLLTPSDTAIVSRMHTHGRGDEALRRHRISIDGVTYFLTLCTSNRATELTTASVTKVIQQEITRIEHDGHWRMRGAVIMPDHLHLLVRISGQLEISRCVARLKSKTRHALSTAGLNWQTNFYEHRLRADEPIEPVLRYLFLNPYHENLVPMDGLYPWFLLGEEDAAWFRPSLNKGSPFPEWLR